MALPAAISGALEKVGVDFIVANLGDFVKGMGSANAAVGKTRETLSKLANMSIPLENMLKGVGNWMKNLALSGVRTLEVALGNLLARAIEKVISLFRDLAVAIIEGGDTFQRLQVRLNRFNLNDLTASGLEYNDALKESIALTKEQIMWTLNLGGLTPFDASDIAEVYSLARSYGFVDAEARALTEDILDFTSGMGLGAETIERIITNLGQMVQQGKITGTELRDLARGSLVPVNKILGLVAESTGMTIEELNKLRKAGETDPQWFVRAFGMMVGEDFTGASESMLNVFSAAVENIKGIFTDLGAYFVTTPIFSVLAERFNAVADGFYTSTKDATGKVIQVLREDFLSSFQRIGESVARIVDRIFNLGGDGGQGIADTIIEGLDRLATWIEDNEDNIVTFVQNVGKFFSDLGTTIQEKVVPWIRDELLPAFERFSTWWSENKELVMTLITVFVQVNLVFMILKYTAAALLVILNPITWVVGLLVAGFLALNLAGDKIKAKLPEISLALENLKIKIREFVDNALAWFQELPDAMPSIGRNIMTALGNGIISAYNNYVLPLLNSIAQAILNVFNMVLDIGSPSKEMEKIGKSTMKGLEKGIEEASKPVLELNTKIANDIKGQYDQKPSSGGGVGKAIADSTGSSTEVPFSSSSTKFLNQFGEVMKATSTKGGDPCAQEGSVAKCTADAIADGLDSGLGGGIGGVNGIGGSIKGIAGSVDTMTKETLASTVEVADNTTKEISKISEESLAVTKQSAKEISKISNDSVKGVSKISKEMAKTTADGVTNISGEAGGMLSGIGTKTIALLEGVASNAISSIGAVASQVGGAPKTVSNSTLASTTNNVTVNTTQPVRQVSVPNSSVNDTTAYIL